MRISLHKCGSDVSRLDDERFEFNVGEGGHITLDTLYNRCLYRDGKQVKLSGANDSKCNNAINHITFTEGLTTAVSNCRLSLLSELPLRVLFLSI